MRGAHMESRDESSTIIIYKSMTPELGLKILVEKTRALTKNVNEIWLLRESREAGMLTVQFLPKNGKSGLIRLCLTNEGWKNANDNVVNELKSQMIKVDVTTINDLAANNMESLIVVIND